MTNPKMVNQAAFTLSKRNGEYGSAGKGFITFLHMESPEAVFKTAEWRCGICACHMWHGEQESDLNKTKLSTMNWFARRLVKGRAYNITYGDPLYIPNAVYIRSFSDKSYLKNSWNAKYYEFSVNGSRIWIGEDLNLIYFEEA